MSTLIRVSSKATRSTSGRTSLDRSVGEGICASLRYDCRKRCSDAVRDSMMLRPRWKSAFCAWGSSGRGKRDDKLPAIEMIGASELLSS